MALGQKPQMLWQIILEVSLFLARMPVAIMVIVTAAFVSWLGVLFAFRVTQYLYTHFLDHPW